tara:strand:+ start:1068 stop:1427 length:360 start_codon:yes stop_codon:yes gene_type:complete
MVCLHTNARMNNGFLCCVDCNRKLNGKLKQTKKSYEPDVNRPINHEECICDCHNTGHSFCLGCKNTHKISEDKMRLSSPLFRAQTQNQGYSLHKYRKQTRHNFTEADKTTQFFAFVNRK